MNCEEARLKVQALIDSELAEDEIEETLEHIQSCYSCRKAYIDLISVKHELKGVSFPAPRKEWFETLEKNPVRRGASMLGRLAFIGSYLLLIAYTVVTFIREEGKDPFALVAVLGICAGFVILLAISIADRMRERKSDRYKEVMK